MTEEKKRGRTLKPRDNKTINFILRRLVNWRVVVRVRARFRIKVTGIEQEKQREERE